ncbi:MAG: hypothetical protein HZB55_22620 [Deltaproteobacteria bacterium]|nr:hypothetical protein [Deltaproteobacteria bacterium]
MKNCKACPDRTDECPKDPDGALLALGPFWGGSDRDCPKELSDWRASMERLLAKGKGSR